MKTIICPRCSGHGKIEKYNHVEAGICFECNESGKKLVDDNTTDIVKEIREQRKSSNEVEKEFISLWNEYKNRIKDDKDWYNYILCEGTESTTKDEERLIRIKQYIEFKKVLKEFISNNISIMDDIDKYIELKKEIENKYLYSRE